MSEKIAEAFVKITELAETMGVESINELNGCWHHKIDDQWEMWVNGHDNPVENEDGVEVPAFHAYVTFNGWPAGLINPKGGTIAAGTAANENAFIEALDGGVEREKCTDT